MDTEAIWEKMLRKTFWGQGGGGIFSAAMSGLDIAMWDIKGKALNVPLYVLLGGKSRDSIRAYASQLQFGLGRRYRQGHARVAGTVRRRGACRRQRRL